MAAGLHNSDVSAYKGQYPGGQWGYYAEMRVLIPSVLPLGCTALGAYAAIGYAATPAGNLKTSTQ